MIRAVIFDVGECLVDETREYGTWAGWLGVPRHSFAAVFGAVIAQGRDYRETFQEFRPGFDLYAERERRARAGQPETFGEEIGLGEGCGGPLARLSGRLREQGAAEGGVRDRCWVQGGGATDQ